MSVYKVFTDFSVSYLLSNISEYLIFW